MPGVEKVDLIKIIEGFLVRIISWIIGFLLALMVILVFSNVIARYFLNSALAWSEEISRFMLIWVAFLGSVLAYVRNEHLGLDILITVLPPRSSRVVLVFANLLVIAAIFVLLHGGWSITSHTFNSGWTSPALSIPYGVVYMIVPVCSLLLLLQAFVKLRENISVMIRVIKGVE